MTASTGTALHAAIMNLKCDTGDRPPLPALAFKLGHRQARHDAAELVSASLGAAQVPSLEKLCAAIEAADVKSMAECNYMLDSKDCIVVLRETWTALSQPSQQGTK